MHRRSFLAGLASLPLSSGLFGSSRVIGSGNPLPTVLSAPMQAPPATKTLDVYFHGLFAFILDSQKFHVHIPKVDIPTHFHVYQVGSPTDRTCTKLSLCNLDPGGEYELQLPGYTGPSNFPATFDDAVHIDPKITPVTMDYGFRHSYLKFPATPTLKSLHRARRNDKLPLFFGDIVRRNKIALQRLGRTYKLSYSSPTAFTPTLVKTSGTACWTYSGQDLHVFAQPDHKIPPTDLDSTLAAFDQLRFMCGKLELFPTPFKAGTFAPVDLDVLCEFGLGERPLHPGARHAGGVAGGVGGGETANCVGIFVGP